MKNYENNRNKKIIKFGKNLSRKYPILRPFLVGIKRKFAPVMPRFTGWGMQTEHDVPWHDDFAEKVFRKTSQDIKKSFQFNKKSIEINAENVDELLWRHWNVSFAIRYVAKFAKTEKYNFCECGVAEGMTTYFALREIIESKISRNFSMHLYDSWGPIKKEHLLESESSIEGRWGELELDVTKKNLSEFSKNIVYHQGYIPNVFKLSPESPESVVYLQIDLNSAIPTKDALEFFYPRLVNGGIIMFDDYGWIGYEDTKQLIDEFFFDKTGILMKLPTGQAIYFHK